MRNPVPRCAKCHAREYIRDVEPLGMQFVSGDDDLHEPFATHDVRGESVGPDWVCASINCGTRATSQEKVQVAYDNLIRGIYDSAAKQVHRDPDTPRHEPRRQDPYL